MSESVKLFSLDRMAKFKDTRNGDTVYIVPGEIASLLSLDTQETWIEYNYGQRTLVRCGVQEVEDEINRALGATHAAHVQIATEARDKIQNILKDLGKSDEEELFNMNDFTPKETN